MQDDVDGGDADDDDDDAELSDFATMCQHPLLYHLLSSEVRMPCLSRFHQHRVSFLIRNFVISIVSCIFFF